MKRLLIVRHAKSSWEFSQLSDFERPLNARGVQDVPDMAQRFQSLGIIPDLIISSPANRALTTAQGFAQILGVSSKEIVLDEDHYHASSDTLRSLIREFPNEHECIMIFGHNPGLTYLINELSDLKLDNLPTCGVCGIEFQIDNWKVVKKGSGRKFYYDFPKNK
ncbi:MAG TPA: histidine phosphatase family protein [Roseivirga sp.]